MPFTSDMMEEIKILTLYNLDSTQEGIKVHSSAKPEAIDATKRLFDKGLVSQEDGGYLTILGITSAEYAQNLQQILRDD